MFKVTKNIWIFGLFQKVYFHGASSQKKAAWSCGKQVDCAHAQHWSCSFGVRHSWWSHTGATQNTPATVSVRDSDQSHTSSLRLMENSRMTHMTWRHQRGIVTPVIVSTRGGEVVIADLRLLFKGRMVSSVTQRSLLGPSEWVTNWPPVERQALAPTRGELMSKWVPLTRFFNFRSWWMCLEYNKHQGPLAEVELGWNTYMGGVGGGWTVNVTTVTSARNRLQIQQGQSLQPCTICPGCLTQICASQNL